MEREEAINIVRKNIPHLGLGATEMTEALESLIPELRESEDEMMSNIILEGFKNYSRSFSEWNDVPVERVIAYLEKQEQKHSCPSNDKLEDAAKEFREKNVPPIESISDELVDIIKGEFEGFRTLLKKKGIDYEPQRGYWEGFARLFDSSAREYVKEQKEQKPISSCDIVPYIDDKIAALQDMWRKEKVAFDWDDMHEMIEDVARHFYQKEQKPTPDWMPKFLDELRSKKNYFDWDGHRDIEGHILAIINWIDPNYFDRKEQEQKSAEWNDTDMKEARNGLISVCRDWECGKQTTLLPIAAVRARYFLEHLAEPWKPSEEQIDALLYAMSLVSPSKKESVTLSELYDRLKELK